MALDPEIQSQLDTLVAEVTAKFEAEKQAAITALKIEHEAAMANAGKEGQAEILATLKSKFGLPG